MGSQLTAGSNGNATIIFISRALRGTSDVWRAYHVRSRAVRVPRIRILTGSGAHDDGRRRAIITFAINESDATADSGGGGDSSHVSIDNGDPYQHTVDGDREQQNS